MLYQKIIAALCFGVTTANYGVHARQKEHVTQSVWDRMVRYTAYQAASTTTSCKIPPYRSSVVKYVVNKITDTQATIFRDDETKEFIVTLPGSASIADFILDTQVLLVPFNAIGVDLSTSCAGCKVHTGFLVSWNAISSDVISTLQSALRDNAGYTISITGHSLGAAIAALGYVSLKGAGLPINAAYTFGQPRSGNQAFANRVDTLSGASDDAVGEFWRITHSSDFVPRAFPTSTGYRYSRTELWQEDDAPERTGPNMTYRCFSQEPTDCNNQFSYQIGDPNAHGYYTNQPIYAPYSCNGGS